MESDTAKNSSVDVESDWIITLVHGTWGRGFFPTDTPRNGPRWFDDGSRFMDHLSVAFGVNAARPSIDVFRWSGSNSIIERERAAVNLAKLLRAQQLKIVNIKQLVIAHSHGGNIALRAVEHLGDHSDKLLIASMACPFVEIFPTSRTDIPFDKYLSLLLLWINLAFAALLLGVSILPHSVNFLPALIAIVSCGWFVYCEIKGQTARRYSPIAADFPSKMARFTSHGAFERSDAALLVMRGVDDEASLALAAGALSSRLTLLTADMIGWLASKIAIPMCIGIFVIALGLFAPFPYINWFVASMIMSSESLFLLGCFMFAFEMMCILLLIPTIIHSIYGRELLFRFLNSEISINSVTDSYNGVTIHTITRNSTSRYAMRHALYDEIHCPADIVSWAKARYAGDTYKWVWDFRRRPRYKVGKNAWVHPPAQSHD